MLEKRNSLHEVIPHEESLRMINTTQSATSLIGQSNVRYNLNEIMMDEVVTDELSNIT